MNPADSPADTHGGEPPADATALDSTRLEATTFEPTLAAAQARLAAVRPAAYARTRNHVDGDVTRLSPYLTHGVLSLREVLAGVLQRGPLPLQHKLVYELAWREYFQHVWHHLGDGIFESLHEGVLPEDAYAPELPADIRQARTGVPAIDQAVRTLYATGYLHNHARMWLASYVVHLRKVHWRCGADWLYGHLIDGDLASNHLSWQWVAGTASSKPYLFNAENVARYAPAPWWSPGTVVDTDYATLDAWARRRGAVPGKPHPHGVEEPALLHAPPAGLFGPPDPSAVQGRRLQVLHPWSMRAPERGDAPEPGSLHLGVAPLGFHAGRPWSARRWHFVAEGLRPLCPLMWAGTADTLQAAWAGAEQLRGLHDAHAAPYLPAAPWSAPERLFDWPARRCHSFSKFWSHVIRGSTQAAEWSVAHSRIAISLPIQRDLFAGD